ncbi:hypothetical protein ACFV2N_47280 [Streptomyces sp. NPDC059680]|uniref:hypothetical protein n=1 Tax=Streptomyces sp. NPDC059680 TaxID=3346904 RepID=UPI003699A364
MTRALSGLRRLLTLATTLSTLTLVAMVPANSAAARSNEPACSLKTLKGDYSGTVTGTSKAAGPLALWALVAFNGDGKGTATAISMTQASGPSKISLKITYTLKSDCTGTLKAKQSTGSTANYALSVVSKGAAVVLLRTDSGYVVTGAFQRSPGSAEEGNLSKACAASTKQNGLVYCTKLFSGNKPIRLPSDVSSTQRYGALNRGGPNVPKFHTRAGDLPLAAEVTEQLQKELPGHSYANTVYLATISQGQVIKIKPAMVIDEQAVLRSIFAGRVMEGTIAPRNEDRYSLEPTLPLRIEFASSPTSGRLTGIISNATKPVRSSTGACFAALNSGATNPLVGSFTANVSLQRVPSMHSLFDDELVLNWSGPSNMGSSFYPSIATLLGGDPLGQTWVTYIHGTPWTGPSVSLHLVSGGGGNC